MDANLAGCAKTRKSTSGVLICFLGAPVHFIPHTQSVIAQSSPERELYAIRSGVATRPSFNRIGNSDGLFKRKEHCETIWRFAKDTTHSTTVSLHARSPSEWAPYDHQDFRTYKSFRSLHTHDLLKMLTTKLHI